MDLRFAKDLGGITLEVKASGDASRIIDFQPAVSLPAKVLGAEFNGRPVPFRVQSNGTDQHVIIRIAVARGSNILRIRTKHDYGLSYCSTLPAIGAASQGLHILSETWTPARDRLTINVSGRAGGRYELFVWNAEQIVSVEGARLFKAADGKTELVLDLPKSGAEPPSYVTIVIQFASADQRRERTKR